MERKNIIFLVVLFLGVVMLIELGSASVYINDVYFTVPDSVFVTNERISFIGYVYQANYSDNGTVVSLSRALANAVVNFTISNSSGIISNYTFTTDSVGAFYSGSSYYTNTTNVSAPAVAGTYTLRAEYLDLNSNISFSRLNITVVNQTLDTLSVSSDKAVYNPSETMSIEAEAVRVIGDSLIYIANVTVSGSVRNSTKAIIQTFSCMTGSNGKCTTSLTAPSSYGSYFVELADFKTFSSFTVVPFSYTLYMKDDLSSMKNVFALGENAKVDIEIVNASDLESYTFSGYIADSAGNSVKAIPSTTLTATNSFSNSFSFTVDSITFSYGTYVAYLNVSKTGDGSIASTTSFQVQDWMLSVNKKGASSGFEYEYSSFPNSVLRFEAIPTYRSNGSVIGSISNSSFSISLKDGLNNAVNSTSANWNASCGKSGCYEFSLTSPSTIGKYTMYSSLSYSGDTQIDSRAIDVISGVMSAQSTDKDKSINELFGTNEYVYLSLSAYNQTSSGFNLSEVEVFVVSYMNGSDFSYTQVSYNAVNSSNSVNEWEWNSTTQLIKMDVPKSGGLYNVYLFGNNRSFGTETKFIVNPYDACVVPKDSASSSNSGYHYVWQFKTTDTVYFEIQLTQANNPLGKATAVNGTGNSSSYGMGSQCNADTTTKQIVSNATLTVVEAKNAESGMVQTLNTSASTCQASDNSGRYTCTIKPSSKWSGGMNIVKINVQGTDGTTSILYGGFESRAFYLYGYSQTWQNNPTSNVTLTLSLYEAGSNWWNSYGSSGIKGSVSVKRIEYQGRDGEWIWPPVDSGYNVSLLNSSSITSGSGSISLPASYASNGTWKTGYYRAVLQATTSSGDTDYGYAWFGVKLWDVYGQPIDCTTSACNYKSYFNSLENISLFVTINKAGANWWNSDTGGQDIYGNVSISVKKIENCKTWPCKELNSSEYSATAINVNSSSPSYWSSSANLTTATPYIIQINKTSGSWNTGYYSVVLNINNTDTGSAWFNTLAFYVETQPVNSSGTGYKYTIRGNQPMYFNVTTTKNYKWSYYGGTRYNESDYINTSVVSSVLRTWDSSTQRSREFNYPTDFNITPRVVNGTGLLNVTYLNGSWPTGYYWGELTLNNSGGETSTGYLWFNVQPFRVQVNTNNYNVDSEQCVNTTLDVYDSDWSSSTRLWGNYSITSVYEDTWNGYSQSRESYSNYTINGGSNLTSFNASTNNVTICPSNGAWGGGSWGGYHYLNILVKDNSDNSTQTGWLSFRTVPFTISWSSGGSYALTSANMNATVTLTKPNGASANGNLTKLYQWRYDNYQSTKEEYRFIVNSSGGSCDSAVSGQCKITGTGNITIIAPSGGWRVGWNYIQAEWTKDTDSSISVQDWSGVSFEGRSGYSGYFSNTDSNGMWKYYFTQDENITIRLYVQDISNAGASVTITDVQYSNTANCWTESCRSYTSATFSPTSTDGSGIANLQIKKSDGTNWSKGDYYIKATIGSVAVTGGTVRVKDFTAPNITAMSITDNSTYNTSISFSATTSENAQCSIYLINYNNFYTWNCWNWNVTNSSNSSSASVEGACNYTRYNYNGSSYLTEWISNNYRSYYDGTNWSSCSSSGGSQYCSGDSSKYTRLSEYMTTGGTSHSMNLNITALPNQHYGLQMWCYDDDYNYVNKLVAFKVNNTI